MPFLYARVLRDVETTATIRARNAWAAMRKRHTGNTPSAEPTATTQPRTTNAELNERKWEGKQ